VLHDSHELNDVVAEVANAGEHVRGKLFVRADAVLVRGDADVGLVDPHALRFRRAWVLERVTPARRRVPETRLVHRRDGEVLGDALDPGGDALDPDVLMDEGDLGKIC
jgi:hypothetical protein